MEKLIKKVKGMNWMSKVSLVLIFTLVFSTFMHQGWYRPKKSYAVDTVVFLTSGASWTMPADWSSTNTIEVIGGGGGGVDAANNGGTGGGGGAYAKVTNVATMPAPGNNVTISIGVGGATSGVDGGNTWICNSTTNCTSYTDTAVVVSAKGGVGGTAGGAGGDISGVGTTEYAGGNGGTPNTTADSGGGGGGAAGTGGAGKNGGNGGTVDTTYGGGGGGGAGGGSSTAGVNGSTTGGNGGAGPTGTAGGAGGNGSAGVAGSNGSGGGGNDGGASGGAGGAGQQWDATHGAGGGGGGGSNGTANPGGNGGLYGGGGGGSEGGVGTGANGIIVITYTPAAVDSTPPTTSGLTFDSPVSGTYIGSPFTFHGSLTDNESNVTSCQYCVKNGSECISTDTWAAGTLSGSSPTWTCTASSVSTYTNAGAITSGDAVYIDVRGTSTGGQNANGGTAITKTMDKLGPNSGASFTATPGNTTCTLNWASTTDAGVGMHSTEPYEVRWQLGSDPGSCSGGAQLYIGTALTTPHNSLTNGSTYYYRLCYKDAFLYQSGYSGNPITCVPVSGPPTLNPDIITAGTWTNEAGGALTPDKINDASDATYAKTTTNGATFDTSFSNDAAYSGKQIDNVRIYVRAYAAGEKIDWGPVIGGTPYLSGTQVTLTTTPTDYFKDWATNPQSGVNWTPAEVDALIARMNAIATGGMSEERVYKVWAEITYSEPPAPVALTHNSTTTSSSKWAGNGGWGLAGTQYGEFVCATCHEPRVTNIKSIKSTITAPSGSFPGSSVTFTDPREGTSNFGDDSTAHANSTKVCEVCHSYDASRAVGVKWHAYNMSGGGADLTHNNKTDCTSTCHPHNQGFKGAGGTCDACHGANPSVFWSVDQNANGNAPGKHLAHFGGDAWYTTAYDDTNLSTGTYYKFNCAKCHGTHGAPLPEITLGSTNAPPSSGGSYAANTCSNLYCHGNYTGGLNASPTWTGTAACGTCHGASVAAPPSKVNHPRHAGNGAGQLSVACSDCHGARASQDGHVDGKIQWSLNTASSKFGTDAKYNTAASGVINNIAPSASYQTCTNLYCHSNVQSGTALTGATFYGTPRWGDASVTCAEGVTGCHNNPPATPTVNSAHTAHTAEGYSFTCAACHSSAGDETTLHANGTINMTISATYGGTYSQGDHTPGSGGYGTCSNVYCHSQGTSTAAPPAPNIAATWAGAMDATCTGCHSGNAAATNKMASNAHGPHINDTANQVGFSVGCAECHSATVSADRTILDAQYHVNKLMNIRFDNGTRNKDTDLPLYNSADARYTAPGGATAAPGAQASCAKVYCHSIGNLDASNNPVTPASDFKTLAWNTGTINCTGCHGESATSKAHPTYATGAGGSTTANNHVKHVEGSSLSCDYCHNTTTTDTAIPPTAVLAAGQHLDRTEDVSFKSVGGKTGTWDGTGGTKSCSTTYCHGSTVPQWGGAAIACSGCHGATNNGDLSSGTIGHQKHYQSATAPTTITDPNAHTTTAYVFACSNCHTTGTHTTGPADPTGPVFQDAQIGGTKQTTVNYGQGGTSTTDAKSFNYTNGTCSTVCHTKDGATLGSGITATPAWNGTNALGCGYCHNKAGDAGPTWTTPHTVHVNAYGVTGNNTNINCEVCHTGTAASNSALQATVAARTQHPDAAKNVAFGTFSGGTWSGTQCQNTYCHSNGTAAAGTHGLISWSGTMLADCSSCHGGNSTAAAKITTNAHDAHTNDTTNQVGFNVSCAVCHGTTVSADRTLLASKATHVNKLTNVRFDNGTLVKDTDLPLYATLDARSTVANGVARTPGSAAASCATVYCHSIGNLDAVGAVITAGGLNFRTVAWNTTIAGCDDCHGDTAGKAHPTYATGAGGSTTANSHVAHVETMAYACDTCHNTTTTSAVIPPTSVLAAGQHLDRTEDVSFNAAGTSTWVPASKTCTTSKCHGTNSAAWGANTATAQCVECHGVAGTTPAGYTADTKLAAPGASNNAGVDTEGVVGAITRGVSIDTEVGAHYGHLYAQSGISSPIACTECHAVPANSVAGIKTHLDGGNADFLWGTLATKGGTMTPAFDAGTHTCSNNRCHNVATNNHTTNATDTTPTWNDIAYFGDVVSPLTATECNRCHYYSSTTNCNGCHGHATSATPTLSFTTASLHINGIVESSGGTCIGCHASTKGTSPVRRATVGEFGLLHGHKKSGRGAVTDADCYPCHWEANSNGTINTTYHGSGAGDGKIDLRDPDSTTLVINLGAGYQFSRNLGSATIEGTVANIQTFCLACHDANGSAVWVSGGSATNPWADGATVTNVETHFAITNTSFHPVLGVQNNTYAASANTMNAPWNTTTHYKITCFDCHAKDGAAGNQNSTIVAHGTNESDTLRAAILTATGTANPLCVVCHNATIYWGANVHSGAGSAWSGNTEARHQPGDHYGCTSCHGVDNYAAAAGTQTTRAEAAHGFNTAGEYAFLRGASGSKWSWDTTNPRTTCDGMNCGTGRSDGPFTYSPGGTY